MASGRMAPSNAKLGRNVDPTLRPDSRLAFRRQVRQTHGTHGTQGIIFADGVRVREGRRQGANVGKSPRRAPAGCGREEESA